MTPRRAWVVVPVLALAGSVLAPVAQSARATRALAPSVVEGPAPSFVEGLPARLTDQQFWKLSSDLSEPDGYFRSDNLVSNEASFQYVIPDLVRTVKPRRVYLGVGPEQNFTYLVSIRPAMAFIIDIRRGNLDLHLLYKALFELSADRAEFVSRVFSRNRPAGLGSKSTAQEIFAAYEGVPASEDLYRQNLAAVRDLLVKKHGFGVSQGDLEGIEYVYDAFFENGPDIQYSPTRGATRGGFGRGGSPTYADLMAATDGTGTPRSYLATDESFAFLRALEIKNLVVPVVGNFGGPKAIRAVGTYLKERGGVVSAFYVSNVEQYLEGLMPQFCANVASLPLDETSTFIRSVRGGGPQSPNFRGTGFGRIGGTMFTSGLFPMLSEVKGCVAAR